jgi:hypothetical protein
MTLIINVYPLKLKVRVNPARLEAQNQQDEKDQFNFTTASFADMSSH